MAKYWFEARAKHVTTHLFCCEETSHCNVVVAAQKQVSANKSRVTLHGDTVARCGIAPSASCPRTFDFSGLLVIQLVSLTRVKSEEIDSLAAERNRKHHKHGAQKFRHFHHRSMDNAIYINKL